MSAHSDDTRPRLIWVNQFAVLPSDGGGTRHFELGRELVRRGWRVTVVASDFHMHSRKYMRRESAADRRVLFEEVEGVRFAWVYSASYARNDWRRAVNWVSFAWAVAQAWAEFGRASLVIGSSPQPLAALAGQRLARRHRVSFVLEVRDLWPESLQAISGRKGPGYHAIGALMHFLYRRAARVIVLASGVGDLLSREHRVEHRRVIYAPNGVDPSGFAERRASALQGDFTALYAGAHGPANGLDAILDAAERLRARSDIRFLLVGDGPAKASLQVDSARRGLSNVEFAPSIPKRAMPALLARCDAGLMILRDTPLFAFGVSPNKLFDYLGAGLPVICNVPGDVAGMVAEAKAGLQTADGSGAALAAAVTAMAATPATVRLAMGRSGQEWVRREHAREVVGARLDAALREVLG